MPMTFEKRLVNAKKLHNKEKLDVLFEDIFNEYSHLVAFIIYKYVKEKEDVEDLVMDVFIKFYETCLASHIANIKSYLASMAKNKAINYVKSKMNKDIVYDEDIVMEVEAASSNYQDIIDEISKYLDQEEVNIIIMHNVYGYSFVEVAKKLNKPATTIRTKYHRIIKKIERQLK